MRVSAAAIACVVPRLLIIRIVGYQVFHMDKISNTSGKKTTAKQTPATVSKPLGGLAHTTRGKHRGWCGDIERAYQPHQGIVLLQLLKQAQRMWSQAPLGQYTLCGGGSLVGGASLLVVWVPAPNLKQQHGKLFTDALQ